MVGLLTVQWIGALWYTAEDILKSLGVLEKS